MRLIRAECIVADPDDIQDWRAGLGARLDLQDQQIDSVRGELTENTKAVKSIDARLARLEAATVDLLDTFHSWQGAMKVLEMIGKAAKPMAAIAGLLAALGAFWVTLRGGK